MTQSIPPFKTVTKDRLFYDRYNFCLSFYLDEASCLRDLSHDNIDTWIKRRKIWREIAQQRWHKSNNNKAGTVLTRRWREITEDTVTNLHKVATCLLDARDEYKLVVSVDQAYIYTNSMVLLQVLDSKDYLHFKTYTQAVVTRPKNTIVLKRTSNKFRTYLKTKTLSAEQAHNLEAFLRNHQNNFRLAPALSKWLDNPFTRTQDYFFIDHDSENWLSMLSLVVPGIIRKTLPIIVGK